MLKRVERVVNLLTHRRLLHLTRRASEFEVNFDQVSKREHDEEFDTPKGEFSGEFQGYGNVDRLDDMFYPEWRTTWTTLDRVSRRVNSRYFDEPFDAHWQWKKFQQDDILDTMDRRYEQYVREFGYKPEEYFDQPEYFAKYGNDEAVWHSWVKNQKRSWPTQAIRFQCHNPQYTTMTACPIHRDVKLLVHYKNVKLLKMFIDPTAGNILHGLRTGCCGQAQLELECALKLAWERGFLLQPLHMYEKRGGWGVRNNLDYRFQASQNQSDQTHSNHLTTWQFPDDDDFY